MKIGKSVYQILFVACALLVVSSCASSKKCSCPNFRGSRAIYGKLEQSNSKYQVPNFKFGNAVPEADGVTDCRFAN